MRVFPCFIGCCALFGSFESFAFFDYFAQGLLVCYLFSVVCLFIIYFGAWYLGGLVVGFTTWNLLIFI